MTSLETQRIFITGVSSGLGRALAEEALSDGHHVVGTVRTPKAREAFESLGDRAKGILLDVTDFAAIEPAIDEIEEKLGPIDVLVNNAGYGLEGTIEEASLDEIRRQFEVNVFGTIAVIQAVLPHMRARKAGRILNITSMGGIITLPGLGLYHGSKFALEGISETLGKEVAEFGIHVTAIEPGAFRTDWAGRSMVKTEHRIPVYNTVFAQLHERRAANNEHHLGDPKRAARAMLEIMTLDSPPTRLLLGSDAVHLVSEKLKALQAEFQKWQELSCFADSRI
ncbi:short-chain dehydrogenase [Acetobacter aceti 1023]|nr:short-chain dehydrogenase [Acetobacter aceti 1023]